MFKASFILATTAVLGLSACAGSSNTQNALFGAGGCAAAAAITGQDARDTALAAAGCGAAGALANDLGLSR